ncbi:alkaline phosphatase family protein [Mycolicibacterium sp.]|uniref:alkaline phosphatase family protein n=1 Tax=Mycolicibacterium sp. TaxID=2320850 RepID=UPI003D14E68E
MGYAKHIGRVGALAITLGVGVALGSSPGVAYADPSTTSSSSETSSTSAGGTGEGAKGSEPSGAKGNETTDSAGGDADDTGTDEDAADDEDAGDVDEDAGDVDEDAGDVDEDAGDVDEDAGDVDEGDDSGAGDPPAAEDDTTGDDRTSDRKSSADTLNTAPATGADNGAAQDDDADPAEDAADATPADPAPAATATTTAADTSTPTTTSTTAKTITPIVPEPAAKPRPTLVSMVSDFLTAVFKPLPKPAPAAPTQSAALLAMLGAVRDELERSAARRAGAVTAQASALDADDTPNVLVIGVDGTNLSRVLANPELTTNFFELIKGGTTAASSIVGHTTISNPSWSAILTGAWGEKTGVINNVFTPWTYNKWPTVFNLLEGASPNIYTQTIANWDVITGIAGAGSTPADNIVFVPHVAGDTDWLLTDDAVGDATEAVIKYADLDVPNFVFSYFVGVDENGHMYGGDSPEYLAALANFDRNLGEIMYEIGQSAEPWTVIMVTDHGHQPQQGLGHGFQSPDETSTFVIANGGLFTPGNINLKYSIVDVTPTVLTLFGVDVPDGLDGVSLTGLGGSDVTPVDNDEALRKALQDAIAMYGYPDIGTTIALSVRTIATAIPYYVYGFTGQIVDGLQSIADAGIFLISPLAQLAIVPVQFFGDLAYVATNFVAQIVARLTGVTGASIFPLWPPAPPSWTQGEVPSGDAIAMACGSGSGLTAAWWCGEAALAV